MCDYIGTEVILANLLNYYPKADQGVSDSDIMNYCNHIKQSLAEQSQSKQSQSDTSMVSFQINSVELANSLLYYPDYFKRFLNRYYKGADLEKQTFEYRIDYKLNDILRTAAENMG